MAVRIFERQIELVLSIDLLKAACLIPLFTSQITTSNRAEMNEGLVLVNQNSGSRGFVFSCKGCLPAVNVYLYVV